MKHTRKIISALGFLGILVGFSATAWANADAVTPPCLVDTINSLGPSLQGTVAAVIINYGGVTADSVDATARLQWQGRERVYRAHLAGPDIPIGSAEDLTCRVLAAEPLDADSGQTLSQVVGVPTTAFKINRRSVLGLNFNTVTGTTNNTAIAEVTIYVVQP